MLGLQWFSFFVIILYTALKVSNPMKAMYIFFHKRPSQRYMFKYRPFIRYNLFSALPSTSTTNVFEKLKHQKVKSYPVSLYINYDLRSYLGLKNHERKSKIHLQPDVIVDIKDIRNIVEKKIVQLQEQPYTLQYLIPGVMKLPRALVSEEEMREVLGKLVEKPPLQLYVESKPGIFPPANRPYLVGMANPMESETYTMLSFYRFGQIESPTNMTYDLQELWKPFHTLGRVYLAAEGINAQMAVPTNVLSNFKEACQGFEFLTRVLINTDHTLTRREFEQTLPFDALHIRVRDKIVSDGLEPLNWEQSGQEMESLEWHNRLSDPKAIVLDCRNSYESDVGRFDGAIPLNTTFFRESWDALDEILKDVPKDAPLLTYCTGGIRCVKINAFLEQSRGFTNVARLKGGIISYARELKAASATQTASESNTEVSVEEDRKLWASKFKGVNYVFDERMGARITVDVFSGCETCGQPSDAYTNCNDYYCHVRFIQCPACRSLYQGCCSLVCRKRFTDASVSSGSSQTAMLSRSAVSTSSDSQRKQQKLQGQERSVSSTASRVIRVAEEDEEDGCVNVGLTQISREVTKGSSDSSEKTDAFTEPEGDVPVLPVVGEKNAEPLHYAINNDVMLDGLNTYCERYSEPESELLRDLRDETAKMHPHATRMVSGALQGRLLNALVSISGATSILELGTFTGYSALCMEEALLARGDGEGVVVTCDSDAMSLSLAEKFRERQRRELPGYSSVSSGGDRASKIDIRLGKAADVIQELRSQDRRFDFVFLDADKRKYQQYVKALLGVTDGRREDSMLKEGALIVVDNVLWKGLVLGLESDLKSISPDPASFGNEKRMQVVAEDVHAFNKFVLETPQLRPVMLPMRDGLSLIRYDPSHAP